MQAYAMRYYYYRTLISLRLFFFFRSFHFDSWGFDATQSRNQAGQYNKFISIQSVVIVPHQISFFITSSSVFFFFISIFMWPLFTRRKLVVCLVLVPSTHHTHTPSPAIDCVGANFITFGISSAVAPHQPMSFDWNTKTLWLISYKSNTCAFTKPRCPHVHSMLFALNKIIQFGETTKTEWETTKQWL